MQGTLYWIVFVILKVKSTHTIIYVSENSGLSLIKVNFNVVNNNYEFLNIYLEWCFCFPKICVSSFECFPIKLTFLVGVFKHIFKICLDTNTNLKLFFLSVSFYASSK